MVNDIDSFIPTRFNYVPLLLGKSFIFVRKAQQSSENFRYMFNFNLNPDRSILIKN